MDDIEIRINGEYAGRVTSAHNFLKISGEKQFPRLRPIDTEFFTIDSVPNPVYLSEWEVWHLPGMLDNPKRRWEYQKYIWLTPIRLLKRIKLSLGF